MTYYSALHYAAKAEKSATAAAKSAEDTAKYAETFNPDNIVNTSTNQTISGVKTFNSSPILKSATPDTVAIVTDEGYLTGYDGISRTELGYLDGVTSNIQTQLNGKAPLASPTFTGTPTVPTPAATDNSTKIATTAWVNSRMGSQGLFCTTTVSGANWSREWKNSSGARVWLEQGGKTGYRDGNSNLTITLPKAFSNTNYTVIVSVATQNIHNNENDALTINSITTTSFGTFSWGARATLWYACGK